MAKSPVYMRGPQGEVFTTDNPEWHKNCEKLTQSEGKAARREYCRAELRKFIAPGQTIYCILRSVSRSGMSREISLFAIIPGSPDGAPYMRNINSLAADAAGFKESKTGAIRVDGCGMDMGFHLVYNLGAALWPDGTPAPHGTRNGGEPDSSGGYALKKEWL